jgi:tRNA A-37 threonylcarbamoyl transferase component Bud32
MSTCAEHPDASRLTAAAPVKVKAGAVRWEVRSGPLAEAIHDLLSQPDDLAGFKSTPIHQTWLVTVTRIALPQLPGGLALMRRSNYAKSKARHRDLFRTAAAVRAFRNALALEAAGVPTPRVWAAGVLRTLRVPKAGYLLIDEVLDAVSLSALAHSPRGASHAAVGEVARAIARMHEAGFVHGDLTINNVLLDGAGKPWFIDLERTQRVRGGANWRQAVEDFHRLARHFRKFSPAGRVAALRLLREYCAARGWKGREREFVRALERRLRHKMAADLAA